MIARIWSGPVRTTDADTYAAYIRETGFAEYALTTSRSRPVVRAAVRGA